MIEDIFSMIAAFIGIICVIILTYYVSKWYARRMGTIAGGKHIRIVDRLIVGKTGSIMIIDVEGTQYMVGVNEHRIEIMKQLDVPVQIRDDDRDRAANPVSAFKSLLHKGKDNE